MGDEIDQPANVEREQATAPAEPRLTELQLVLLNELNKLDASVGRRYTAGLRVLADVQNPERFGLAAHAFRELMGMLLKYVDLAIETHTDMTTMVKGFESKWEGAQHSSCLQVAGWEGPIDIPLQGFLLSAGAFFSWFQTEHPKRRDQSSMLLERLDIAQRPLPEPLAKTNLQFWEQTRRYFNKVAHFDYQPTEDEFVTRLGRLERFLLDLRRPQTFDDQVELAALIHSVEVGDE